MRRLACNKCLRRGFISSICLVLVFSFYLLSAPAPLPRKKVSNFPNNFPVGKWEITWNSMVGIIYFDANGHTTGIWPSKWNGRWAYVNGTLCVQENIGDSIYCEEGSLEWKARLTLQEPDCYVGTFTCHSYVARHDDGGKYSIILRKK